MALLALSLSFAFGLYTVHAETSLYRILRRPLTHLKEVIVRSRTPDEAPFLQPARGPGDGVVRNEVADDHLVMMAGFFDGGNQIRLVERVGTVVARWPVSYTKLFPEASSFLRLPPVDDFRIDLHGALIEPDGSVVFNFDYGGMAKLSRCGDVVWTVRHPTHHSVERSRLGGYWVPGREEIVEVEPSAFPPFSQGRGFAGISNDLVLRIGEDGEIVERISVVDILLGSSLESYLTATGMDFERDSSWWDGELVHLNKIGELSEAMAASFPAFEVGDLLLSLRQYNMILVVEPGTWEVRWHQTGPWIRQHDPEFNPDGTITVFNNNTYRSGLRKGRSSPSLPQVTNILRVDPTTGRTEVAYGGRDGQRLLTHIRGQHDPLPDGGFLIVEFEGGRVLQTDALGRTVWEYVNRFDADFVAEVTSARLYPRSEFAVDDWSC